MAVEFDPNNEPAPDGDLGVPVTEGQCHCAAIRWRFKGTISEATTCNCTACRKYAALWAYGYENREIEVDDPADMLVSYTRKDQEHASLSFDFCRRCGNLVRWRGLTTEPGGLRRTAVNLRLAEPESVAAVPLTRFDGLTSFHEMALQGHTVSELLS